jgi:hypothetical protein
MKEYKIPIDFGGHILHLIIGTDPLKAEKYISKKYNFEIEGLNGGAYCFFVGHYEDLFLFLNKEFTLDYIVHEVTHIYKYIEKRLSLGEGEQTEAYTKQLLFKEIVKKLESIKRVEIKYS